MNEIHNKYIYWVVFHYTTNNGFGYGGMRIWTPIKASSLNWLIMVNDFLKKSFPEHSGILIINYFRLKDDEQWENV